MTIKRKNTIGIFVVALFLFVSSCSSAPSLQRYFVEKTENANFLIINFPINLSNFSKTELSASEEKTLKSIHKLNVLLFYNTEAVQQNIASEIATLNTIFEQSQYNKLSDFGHLQNKASLYYTGKERKVDEGILYLHNKEKGLAVVRILGDNMNPGALLMLIDKINRIGLMEALGSQITPLFETLSQSNKQDLEQSI